MGVSTWTQPGWRSDLKEATLSILLEPNSPKHRKSFSTASEDMWLASAAAALDGIL